MTVCSAFKLTVVSDAVFLDKCFFRLAKSDSCHSEMSNNGDNWMNDFVKEGRDKSSEINALATLVCFRFLSLKRITTE